jgi:hypothetical protein
MYILYYILAYIQHNGDVSLENVRLLLCSISVHKRTPILFGRSDILWILQILIIAVYY